MWTAPVTPCGLTRWKRRKINHSTTCCFSVIERWLERLYETHCRGDDVLERPLTRTIPTPNGVAERLDYPDEPFDVVVGIDILHHVEIHAAIAEVLRVLKPGGKAGASRLEIFDHWAVNALPRRGVPARADRQSVQAESVTYVPGMICYPCLRNGP